MSKSNQVLELPLSWDGNSFRFTFPVKNVLKWGAERLITSGVFSGCNDRGGTFFYRAACSYINEIKKYHKVSLYSVIGGCFLYDLVKEVDFDRVVLFDENIAEFGKIAYMLNSFDKEGLSDAYSVTQSLETYVRNNPSCILPGIGNEYIDMDFSKQSTQGAMYAGMPINDKTLLLPSDSHPDCVWNVNKQEANLVYSRLKKSLVGVVHTCMPAIDACKTFAVVFTSNAGIPASVVKKLITNHSGLLVVRSLGNYDYSNIDAHVFWDSVAISCFVGKTHQCWNSECTKNVTNVEFNQFVQSSSFIDDNNVLASMASIPKDTDTLLTHILLGHSKEGLENKKKRVDVLKDVFENIPVHIRRLVVAEFNPEGEMSDSVKPFTSLKHMQEYIDSCVKKSGLHCIDVRYAPGCQDARRNVFFVFARKP